ncbi:hypothetical protein FA95DRAFT_1575945 [Auriscalpium vulgare]|uniref:Uncharacterized protein n=1 Tax=Auriscalpium vulgare TaxID=40419 RepID=A0ACB8RD28_9AGAM|nr:hypothetical protein FA95DRAFT_1575945 [Auriscalpium vulgare]
MANRITVNPYDLQPPVYRPEVIATAIVGQETPDEAQQRMLNLWTQNNALERGAWDAQVAADKVVSDAAAAQEAADRVQEERLAAEEAEKRRPQLPDFNPNGKIGDKQDYRPSDTALALLKAGKYAPLYYFTSEGCETHGVTASDRDDDDAVATLRKDGTVALKEKPLRACHQDERLTAQQVSVGLRCLLTTLIKLRWPDKHVDAL